jgi:hypothetical protein
MRSKTKEPGRGRCPLGSHSASTRKATTLKPAGNMFGTGYRSPNAVSPGQPLAPDPECRRSHRKRHTAGGRLHGRAAPTSPTKRPSRLLTMVGELCVGTSPRPGMETQLIVSEESLCAAGWSGDLRRCSSWPACSLARNDPGIQEDRQHDQFHQAFGLEQGSEPQGEWP